MKKCLRGRGSEQENVHDLLRVGDSTWSPRVQSAIQEFFNDEEPTAPSTLMKQWNIALQRRTQSSQVKALRSEGHVFDVTSLPMGWRLLVSWRLTLPLFYFSRAFMQQTG